MFTDRSTLNKDDLDAVAEEKCVCKRSGFGCIIVFPIKDLRNWSKEHVILAHEIGHTLGSDPHDDDYYYTSQNHHGKNLIMWSNVFVKDAFIWSPHARKKIKQNKNTCLKKLPAR